MAAIRCIGSTRIAASASRVPSACVNRRQAASVRASRGAARTPPPPPAPGARDAPPAIAPGSREIDFSRVSCARRATVIRKPRRLRSVRRSFLQHIDVVAAEAHQPLPWLRRAPHAQGFQRLAADPQRGFEQLRSTTWMPRLRELDVMHRIVRPRQPRADAEASPAAPRRPGAGCPIRYRWHSTSASARAAPAVSSRSERVASPWNTFMPNFRTVSMLSGSWSRIATLTPLGQQQRPAICAEAAEVRR